MMAILPAFIFISCSEDEVFDPSSPKAVKKALIGAWTTSIKSSNWKTIEIRPNGGLKYNYYTKDKLLPSYYGCKYDEKNNTYSFYDENYNSWTYDPESNAHWVFDESTQSISMYTDDGYYTYTFKVVMADDTKSWVGITQSGETAPFIKIEE